MANQRVFDFDAAQRTEKRRLELAGHLESLGLTTAERLIVIYLWQHGQLVDNRSALKVSQSRLAKAIGYSVSWARTSLIDLETFRVIDSRQPKTGAAKIYVVDWTRLSTLQPVRAQCAIDVFAEFDAAPATSPETSSETSSPTTVETTVPTSSETSSVTSSLTSSVTTVPHTHSSKSFKPHGSHTHTHEGGGGGSSRSTWGRHVDPAELRTWPGRRALWKRACAINPEIDPGDFDDVAGFVAAVLCCQRPGVQHPLGMLLSFVRRRAWRFRGKGGIDGHWISKGVDALRELQRERDLQPVGAQCNSSD